MQPNRLAFGGAAGAAQEMLNNVSAVAMDDDGVDPHEDNNNEMLDAADMIAQGNSVEWRFLVEFVFSCFTM